MTPTGTSARRHHDGTVFLDGRIGLDAIGAAVDTATGVACMLGSGFTFGGRRRGRFGGRCAMPAARSSSSSAPSARQRWAGSARV